MAAFDPDKFLADAPAASGFDPDAFLGTAAPAFDPDAFLADTPEPPPAAPAGPNPSRRFDVEGFSQVTPAPTIKPETAAMVARIGGPILAPIAGASLATPAAPLGIAALTGLAIAGGAAGQAVGDAIENKPTDTPDALMRQAGAGLVAGAGMAIPAPQAVLRPAANLIRQAAVGGTVGGGLTAAQQALVDGKMDLGGILAGTVIGTGAGLVRGAWQNADTRQALIEQAQAMGFKGRSADDLARWVDDERAARAQNVTGSATPPPAPLQAPAAQLRPAGEVVPTPAQPAPRAPAPAPAPAAAPVPVAAAAPRPAAPNPAVPSPEAVAAVPALAPFTGQPIGAPAPSAPLALPPSGPTLPEYQASMAAQEQLARGGPADQPPAPLAAEAPATPEAIPAANAGDEAAPRVAGTAEPATTRKIGKQAIDLPSVEAATKWVQARPTLRNVAMTTAADGTVRVTFDPKGPGFKLPARSDGVTDIIDQIQSLGGVPAAPRGAKGGEWNGHRDTFSGTLRVLVRGKGNVTDWLKNLEGTEFANLVGDPDGFYAAVQQAANARQQLKAADAMVEASAKFQTAALEGRTAAGKPRPVDPPQQIDELRVGDGFRTLREEFKVVGVNPDDGSVIVRDGPRFGEQVLPPGGLLYPDKGSFKPAPPEAADDWPTPDPDPQPPAVPGAPAAPAAPAPGTGGDLFGPDAIPFNLASERQAAPAAPAAPEEATTEMFGAEVRTTAPTALDRANAAARESGAAGAMADPGMQLPPPTSSGPGTPPPAQPPPPSQNPNYTQLPIELPEAVQFFLGLSGKYPQIVRQVNALNGNAAGVFRYREGQLGSIDIALRADLFNLLSVAEKQELMRQAVAYATGLRQVDPQVNFREAIQSRFNELVAAAEKASMAAGPRRALATFWHEIGHYLDFLPEGTIKRGNILGRLASLNRYSKNFLGEHPGITAEPPDDLERAALRRRAEKELRDQVQQTVETIRREVPVFREIPITADDITSILKNAQRSDFPDLYDWFAKLDRKEKAAVLRKAMQGVVDERAAAFGRKEATGEVKIEEEKVTRASGPEPTKADILARYEELLRAELRARGLVSATEIRAELTEAIKWWRNTKEMPAYFKPSVEMWADTMSIFFNNPRALAEKAPTFYRAWMGWMERKPEVKAAYDALQRDIASGQIHKDRVVNLREMFAEDEAAGLAIEKAADKRSWQHVRDTMRLLFDRQFGPIERRVRAQQSLNALDNRVLDSVDNYIYRTTAWEAYAAELRNAVEVPLAEADLTHVDMAEYLFHKRITEGSRRELANPLGWNPKNSAERLAEMAQQMGPARMQVLEQTQRALRDLYERRVIVPLERAGVMSPELAAAVREEVFYVPFNQARTYVGAATDAIEALVKLHYGEQTGAKIYSQVGNLGEIRNPYVQLHQRAFGLMNMAQKQIATKAIVQWLQTNEPLSIAPAATRFNGRRLEIIDVENPRVATLYVLNEGKVEGFYVPRVIGEMFSSGAPLEKMILGLAHTALSPIKGVLTELNPGFWPVAFVKDVGSAVLQMPEGARIIAGLPRSYMAARQTFVGGDDRLAQQVLDRMMVISRADPRGDHLGHADEMTRILLRLGKSPAQWGAEVGKIERALRAFWQAWTRQGQILERTVKIAGMRHLDERFPHLPEGEKRRLVRELSGSPAFSQRGRWASLVELGAGMMFYNAWKESHRSTWRAMKRDPRGFWTKFLGGVGLGAAALWAFESGGVGEGEEAEDYRDKLRAIPERDKLRGFPIVLGWADKKQGKVAYIILPFPDNVRGMHALFRKTVQTSTGQGTGLQGLESALQYQGQDLPGEHPLISNGRAWWEYWVEKRNPYDDFTGRGMLDEDKVTARTAGTDLALKTASDLMGGIPFRYRPDQRDAQPTDLEQFLQRPVVSNLLGRWVRVSNAGLAEQYRADALPVQKEEAFLRTVGDQMIARGNAGLPWTEEQTSLISESPYLAQYLVDASMKSAAGMSSPLVKALTQARSNAQKMAILQAENDRNQAKLKRLYSGGAPTVKEPIPLPAPAP